MVYSAETNTKSLVRVRSEDEAGWSSHAVKLR